MSESALLHTRRSAAFTQKGRNPRSDIGPAADATETVGNVAGAIVGTRRGLG